MSNLDNKRQIESEYLQSTLRRACRMKMNRYLIALILGFAGLDVLAAERQFRSINEFLATLPAQHKTQVVEGDLNGDKLNDRAIIEINVISDQNSANFDKLRIYVLLQKQDGSFELAQASKVGAVESSYKILQGIRIEKGSLYLEFEGGLRPSWERYQFKLYKGSWRLIGMTQLTPNPYRTLKDGGVATDGSDFNLLTGDFSYISDEQTSQQEIVRSKVNMRACFLADFDFSEEFVEKFCKR